MGPVVKFPGLDKKKKKTQNPLKCLCHHCKNGHNPELWVSSLIVSVHTAVIAGVSLAKSNTAYAFGLERERERDMKTEISGEDGERHTWFLPLMSW